MFFQNIHSFRGVAIFFIVSLHALQNFQWAPDSLIFSVLDSVANEASIWFCFIAGFLFQHLSKNFTPKAYFSSKLQNVISPYILISIPALFFILYLDPGQIPEPFRENSEIAQILLLLGTGSHMAQLWFIPTISIIFLLAPILVWGDQRNYLYYFLPILIVFSVFLGRTGIQEMTGWGLYASPLSKAVYLLSSYIAGMFCRRYYKQTVTSTLKIWPLLILAYILVFWQQITLEEQAISWMFLAKMLTAPLLIVALEKCPNSITQILSVMGHYSFGVFFIHGYFLALPRFAEAAFPSIQTSFFTEPSIIKWLFFSAIVMGICVFILKVAKIFLKKHSRKTLGI